MKIRDNYFRCTCNPSSWLFESKYDGGYFDKNHSYDTMHGIRKAVVANLDTSEAKSIIYAALHSVQALQATAKNANQQPGDTVAVWITQNHYLSRIMCHGKRQSLAHLSDIVEDPTVELLTDEGACIFLDFITSRSNHSPFPVPAVEPMSEAFSEIQLRLMGYMYEKPHKSNIRTDGNETELQGIQSGEIQPFVIRPDKVVFMSDNFEKEHSEYICLI